MGEEVERSGLTPKLYCTISPKFFARAAGDFRHDQSNKAWETSTNNVVNISVMKRLHATKPDHKAESTYSLSIYSHIKPLKKLKGRVEPS